MNLPLGTRVGLWIRVSSDSQVRDESPAVHLVRAQEYAEAQGWEVVDIYRLKTELKQLRQGKKRWAEAYQAGARMTEIFLGKYTNEKSQEQNSWPIA